MKWVFCGAGEGIRTLDFNLGKVAIYPLATPALLSTYTIDQHYFQLSDWCPG